MRIAFADFCHWDFNAQSVDFLPMGGAQSAACYLARRLAREGHEVYLISSVSWPGTFDGVTCLPWQQADAARLQALRLDVMICLLAAGYGAVLRQMLGPRVALVLWNQHAHDQPAVQALREARERMAYNGFAMVSEWQRQQYQSAFGLDPAKVRVMRNAIAPAFHDLFPAPEPILEAKTAPPVLAYTSTPFRGLDMLLDAFPQIRARTPGVRLRVYSSMKVYQASAAEDEAAYGALYQRCRQMEGVDYIGSVPQPALAQDLRKSAVLAYPNTFAETSCISVMEALAAGCRVISSRLGALPETGASFARLIPMDQTREAYLRQFVEETVQAVREYVACSPATEATLRRQVTQMNETNTWPHRAREWAEWLEELVVM